MLRRIYIDNFRCLVNFELKVDSLNLFLGANGSGKSTVFEVLQKIQAFVAGDRKVEGIFKATDCTRWQSLPIQRFELEIQGNGGNYKYELGIGHHRDRSRVEYERLGFDGKPLLKFELGEVQLYRDDGSEGANYPFDWSQSVFPSLMPRDDNTKLTEFGERMARFIIVRILPSLMVDESRQKEKRLSPNMENYVSWYRFFSDDQGKIQELSIALKEVLDGFLSFRFEQIGEQSLLMKSRFVGDKKGSILLEYRLGELSDGQKMLIALYTLLCATKQEDYTLCIDEPENFLALPEIQPWLVQLYDLCSEGQLQAFLISHHPESLNYLLASPIGYWFERQSNAPVRVKKIGQNIAEHSGLPVSELIARGWLNEPA